jgi:splicing factor U2AF subunit
MELAKYGEIEEMNVCDNIGEHLLGNVYVKYNKEEDADKGYKGLNGRFYAGKSIKIEYSPVTDFRESRCRQFKEGSCNSNAIVFIFQK